MTGTERVVELLGSALMYSEQRCAALEQQLLQLQAPSNGNAPVSDDDLDFRPADQVESRTMESYPPQRGS